MGELTKAEFIVFSVAVGFVLCFALVLFWVIP